MIFAADQNPHADASRRRGFNIRKLVTQSDAAAKIEIEVRCCLQEHSGSRLSPKMICLVAPHAMFGVEGAVIHACDGRTFRGEAPAHPVCQLCKCAFIEIAAADARLVACDDNRPADLLGPEFGQIEYA